MPPYTTRSAGRSATSGSRLFIKQRSAASCCQPLQRNWLPRGARIIGVVIVVILSPAPSIPLLLFRSNLSHRDPPHLRGSCRVPWDRTLQEKSSSSHTLR